MPILGAHMSVAGGYWKAVEAAAKVGCDCVQVFTKNNNQWRAKEMTPQDGELFHEAMQRLQLTGTLSHASYLINLASPKPDLRQKSVDALVIELERANFLGIPNVVFHPGSHTTSSPEEGIAAIVQSLIEVLDRTEALQTTPLLENTAGQGSNLGWQFEQLEEMIEGVRTPDRIGVCIDTCHAFAAGYPMGTEVDYEKTISKMSATFGLEKIKAFHLNDSKKPFASRKDRHEHIGQGEMGLEPFRHLVNDERFATIPMYLETEKGDLNGKDMDEMNLEQLRALIE